MGRLDRTNSLVESLLDRLEIFHVIGLNPES